MNQKLGATANAEICKAMTGLADSAAKAEAERLAGIHGCSSGHIYRMTAHLRQGKRKRRSDAGERKFSIAPGTDTFEAAALVIGAKLDPDQALLTAKANGHANLPSLSTMRNLLNEKGLNRRQRKTGRRNHRRFQAEAPLDMIQIDCTALKIRWQDVKTRRILRIEGIDKNHPQLDAGKLRVWQIMAVDDHSGRRFLRYVTCGHITSKDMVRFVAELSCEWGLTKQFYTDNGPEFKGFFAKAVRILNTIPAIRETGGCEHRTHAPNNPQASGKVEVAHQWAEKMDRLVGLAIDRGIEVDENKLNEFADSVCGYYNEVNVLARTGRTPLASWFGTRVTTRMLPRETVVSALLFEESERTLTDTMTVRVGKLDYRIPARDAAGGASPFKVGMRLTVIVPTELDVIFVTLANGDEYEVAKEIATPDVAGSFKAAPQSEAEQLTKQLRDHHRDRSRQAKEKRATTGEVYQVPFFNHEISTPQTNVASFPHPVEHITDADVAAASPVGVSSEQRAASSASSDSSPLTAHRSPAYIGRPLNYWAAVKEFKDRFANIDDCKSFLREIFPDDAVTVPVTQIEAAIDNRNQKPKEALRIAS